MKNKEITAQNITPYSTLSPSSVLVAAESLGYVPTGRVLALNSYENRVYQVEVEEGDFIVLKFYRPQRWSKAQILEEHAFCFELEDASIPVVAPLELDGESVFESEGFLFAVYEYVAGQPVELKSPADYREMGRQIGRIHAVGEKASYKHRLELNTTTLGWESLKILREEGDIPAEMMPALDMTATQILKGIEQIFREVDYQKIRQHSDAHLGNILVANGVYQFMDLDDSMQGPSIQDMWLFLDGSDGVERSKQLGYLVEGYQHARAFNMQELKLIEPLRALRMLHHAAWIAQRWSDPAFPTAFPYFKSAQYWVELLDDLKEQLRVLEEPVLISI